MKLFSRSRSPARARARDHKLLTRAAAGSTRALERLYDRHVDRLYAFVFYRVGRDPEIAEDVVQETFAAALDRIERFDPERGSLESWLFTLSRNAIRDQLRTHRRSAELAAMWERVDRSLAQIFESLDQVPLSDELLARAETRDMVNITIAHLPETYRLVLERKYIAGDSVAGVARDLGLSADAAKSLLARARRAFRETFATLSKEPEGADEVSSIPSDNDNSVIQGVERSERVTPSDNDNPRRTPAEARS